MKEPGRKKFLAAGLLAGLIAALAMTLAMMLLRLLSGVATPPELVGDRIAPLLSVETFLGLLSRAGGYNQLKQLGVVSVLAGQFAVGALGGSWYAWLTERARARQPEQTGRFGVNRRGLLFVALFVGTLWLASIVLLWPVLGTHYGGRPPGQAAFVTALGLLFSYAVYGLTLSLCYGVMASPAPLSQPTRAGQPNGRRAVLVAGAGVLLKGVAHGGDRGVSRVEVSTDDGRTWREATVDDARSPSAWALWSYDWRPRAPGEYKLAVRAADGAGALQTKDDRGIVPEGSTAYHRITVNVEA